VVWLIHFRRREELLGLEEEADEFDIGYIKALAIP